MFTLFLIASLVTASPLASSDPTKDFQPNTLYQCQPGTGSIEYGMVCPNDVASICGFDGNRDSVINSYFPKGKSSATLADCNDRATGDTIFMNWKPNTLYECKNQSGAVKYGTICDGNKLCGFDGDRNSVIKSYFPKGKRESVVADCNNISFGEDLFMNWKPKTLYHCDSGTGTFKFGTLCPNDANSICGFRADSNSVIKKYFPEGKALAVPADCNNKNTGKYIFT